MNSLDWNPSEKRFNWELVFCELYAGGKYNNNQGGDYDFSLGTNGLGDEGAVRLGILWQRMAGLMDEVAQAFVRTSFSVVVRETGRKPTPIPEVLFAGVLGRFGLPRLPRGALGHIKYPVVIDGEAFRKATGFQHQHDELSCIADYRSAFPVPR